MKIKKVITGIMVAVLVASATIIWQGNDCGQVSEAASKLAAPKLVGTDATANSVTSEWKSVKGAKGYFVYQYDDEICKMKKVKDVKKTKVTITGLEDGRSYDFKIAAYKIKKGKKVVQKKSGYIGVTTPVDSNRQSEFANLTVYDGDGKSVTLSEFVGKPMVVNCWATWCGPCVEELPHFQKFYEQYKDKITFVMVNVWDEETGVAGVNAFLKEKGYTFPVYYDDGENVQRVFRLSSIPYTAVFNAEGKIVDFNVGGMEERTLKALIDEIM